MLFVSITCECETVLIRVDLDEGSSKVFQARPKRPNPKETWSREQKRLAWSRDLWTVGAHALAVSQVLCGCNLFLALGTEATTDIDATCCHQD